MQLKIDNKETLEANESNLRLLQAKSNLLDPHSTKINRKIGKRHIQPLSKIQNKRVRNKPIDWIFCLKFFFSLFTGCVLYIQCNYLSSEYHHSVE